MTAPVTERRLLADCRAGRLPAEALSSKARADLFREFWAAGWTNQQIAEHTRTSGYTVDRIHTALFGPEMQRKALSEYRPKLTTTTPRPRADRRHAPTVLRLYGADCCMCGRPARRLVIGHKARLIEHMDRRQPPCEMPAVEELGGVA